MPSERITPELWLLTLKFFQDKVALTSEEVAILTANASLIAEAFSDWWHPGFDYRIQCFNEKRARAAKFKTRNAVGHLLRLAAMSFKRSSSQNKTPRD